MDNLESNLLSVAQSIIASDIDARMIFVGLDPSAPAVVAPAGESAGVDLLTLAPAEVHPVLATRLALAQAASRSALEQPLDGLRRAASRLVSGGDLRPGAFLSFIVVGDEDDESPGGVASAIAALSSVHGVRNLQRFALSAVVRSRSEACEAPRTARPAPRLIDMVRRTGGSAVDICEQKLEPVFRWPGRAHTSAVLFDQSADHFDHSGLCRWGRGCRGHR